MNRTAHPRPPAVKEMPIETASMECRWGEGTGQPGRMFEVRISFVPASQILMTLCFSN